MIVLLAVFAWHGSAAGSSPAPQFGEDEQPMIAAQVHRLAGSSWSEIAAELDRLKQSGFNTLIFRVFQNRGDRFHQFAGFEKGDDVTGVYFATTAAPIVADMLTTLARLCRERNIRLFAWMTTRRMDWLDKDEWLDRCYDTANEKLVPGENFDLFNAQFIDYLLTLYHDLASQQIDGIVLQDDFAILTREGFTAAGRERFRKQFNLEVDPETVLNKSTADDNPDLLQDSDGLLFLKWSVFKSDYLSGLGENIIGICRDTNPHLSIAINLYYDTVMSRNKGLCWLGQDLEGIYASSFDKILFMAYHRQVAGELNLSVREAIEILSGLTAQLSRRLPERLVVKMQAVDWQSGEALDAEELKTCATALVPGPANVAFAPVEHDGVLYGNLSSILTFASGTSGPAR